jgi:hypothetical protein
MESEVRLPVRLVRDDLRWAWQARPAGPKSLRPAAAGRVES